uniref:SV2 related protein b n=1 Tax=Pundamilia nyererei TaxID=303518 RepID=A0A3B4FQI6_9CICH
QGRTLKAKTSCEVISFRRVAFSDTISEQHDRCVLLTETFTVDDALEAIGFGKFQWKISFLTGLSWVADAMEMMILSILGPQLHCEWRLPSYKVALITSVVFIGMGISSPIWGNVADKYGRKVGLKVCMCWTLYYGLLSAFAPAYGWLLFLRGLVGFGIGGAPQSVTLYSEFLPMKARGICIMLIAAFWAIGAVFEVLLALMVMPDLGWRWMLGLSTVPLAIFVCFCFWLPESPRFDVLSGRREKAMATLTRIAKENGKTLPQGRLIAYNQNERGRFKDLFAPQYWKTTLLLWFIWFSNAFSYYGIILLTTELFQAGDLCAMTQGAKIEPDCSLECRYLTSADYKDLLWTTLAEFPGKILAACSLSEAWCAVKLKLEMRYNTTPSRVMGMGMHTRFTIFTGHNISLGRTSVYLTLSVYCSCSLLAGVASWLLPIETLGRNLQESSLDQETAGCSSTSPFKVTLSLSQLFSYWLPLTNRRYEVGG